MSTQTVKLGSQTITPKVQDMGNTYYIEFKVKITKYLGNTVGQVIDVKFICNKYKTVVESTSSVLGTPPVTKKVEKTIQECVDEWYNIHKSVYEVA